MAAPNPWVQILSVNWGQPENISYSRTLLGEVEKAETIWDVRLSASDIRIVSAFGTAEGIRPPDLLVRSQSLYPAELQPHFMCSKKSSCWRLSYITTDWTEMQVPF